MVVGLVREPVVDAGTGHALVEVGFVVDAAVLGVLEELGDTGVWEEDVGGAAEPLVAAVAVTSASPP